MDDGTPADTRARFWAKVDYSGPRPEHRPELGPCWLWTASLLPTGYGQFRVRPRTVRAHRLAYELAVGPIPAGLDLDHLCRVKRCVRPSHLEPVTRRENTRRAYAASITHCPHGHPYDEANTYRSKPSGQRRCRACWRIWYEAKKASR